MADADALSRPYLVVNVHGPASSDAVAGLFEAAATALRGHGEVVVQHVAYEAADRSAGDTTSLTLYYDRVERRQHPRD